MGESTENLRREIADTRTDLSETLDAIGDRVSPGRMVERRKNMVTQRVQSVRDRVMGPAHQTGDAVKDMPDGLRQRTEGAPMLAGALAFGVGFLIAAVLPASSTERRTVQPLLEKAEPIKAELVESARDVAEHLKEPATEAARSAGDAAKSAAHDVMDEAKDTAEQVKERAADSR